MSTNPQTLKKFSASDASERITTALAPIYSKLLLAGGMVYSTKEFCGEKDIPLLVKNIEMLVALAAIDKRGNHYGGKEGVKQVCGLRGDGLSEK